MTTAEAHTDRPLRVLALDGGGIRGVIPAMVLAEIERKTGKRIAELFDLIAGTSTGGILALGLTVPDDAGKPRNSADDLVALYAEKGNVIFRRSFLHWLITLGGLVGSKYALRGLEQTLRTYFGDARLKDAVTEVVITSYDLESRDAWFLARHKAQEKPAENDFPMRDVARSTSAAPTYFAAERLSVKPPTAMVDGGVFANNPAMCAYVEAIKLHPDADPRDVLVVSLGTGQVTTPIRYARARAWGLIGWVRPLIDVIFDGQSDTVDHQLSWILGVKNGSRRYVRFQTELPTGMGAMDNTSKAHIDALKLQAGKIIAANKDKLDQLCGVLTGGVGAPAPTAPAGATADVT
jgi:patatin-like phospholipase/acyl hydrolase